MNCETFLHIPQPHQAKMCLQRMCRKRRPRSDYICAVWSGPLLSTARITGYYRMYPWRAIALTFLHIPQPHQETRGPWWSYIAHLTKQICIFTVEVSAKFTALGFLYKLYSTNRDHFLARFRDILAFFLQEIASKFPEWEKKSHADFFLISRR